MCVCTIMLRASVVLCCVAAAASSASSTASTLDDLRSYAPCFKGDAIWPCLKQRALVLFNKVLLTDSIELAPGLVVARDEESGAHHFDASDELHLPADPQSREHKLDELLWSRAVSFLTTRTVTFDFGDSGIDARFMKKKIKKYVLPFLLIKLSLGFMAAKALLIGKLAMALTVFVMIRDFIEERKKTTHETYEVFANKHPVEGDHHYFEASNPVHQTLVAPHHPSGAAAPFYPTSGGGGAKGRSIPPRQPTAPAVDLNDHKFDNSQFAQVLAYGGHRPAAVAV